MYNNVNNDRAVVSELLKEVLLGQLCVREAMLKYPRDTQDESLIAAYHALIHYEADEDMRAHDIMYRQEQDDYIAFISETLSKGEDLPRNIIDNYKEFYDTAPILHNKGIRGFIKSFWKNLNVKDE